MPNIKYVKLENCTMKTLFGEAERAEQAIINWNLRQERMRQEAVLQAERRVDRAVLNAERISQGLTPILLDIDELPQGALARYERDIAVRSYIIPERNGGT